MKIYFATSISGVITDESSYYNKELINILKNYGEVLTEHFSNAGLQRKGEAELTDKFIHDRDVKWIDESECIVADVTNPSLGVGYEIRYGTERGKKILCLKRKDGKRLSAMIKGNGVVETAEYGDIADASELIKNFFNKNYGI